MLQLRVCSPSSMLTTRFAFATLLLFVCGLEVSGFSIFFEGRGLEQSLHRFLLVSLLEGWLYSSTIFFYFLFEIIAQIIHNNHIKKRFMKKENIKTNNKP
uniref:(northern house mosquito) hypothetical protein n=1 Tax=Culex pipiens TaxID=7175 RepID=A0A8D8HL99_CULPI